MCLQNVFREEEYTEWPQNVSNGHKIYQNISDIHKISQYFPFQGPPKNTQSGILVQNCNIWQPCLRIVCGRQMAPREASLLTFLRSGSIFNSASKKWAYDEFLPGLPDGSFSYQKSPHGYI
jgi:hypothetical protein